MKESNEPLAHLFSLSCTECNHAIEIPISSLSTLPLILQCGRCQKKYGFHDSTIVQQMKQFISLCKEIKASEDILSHASIAVRMGTQEVKIPFKLLLTRLRSTFNLMVGNEKMTLSYRTEPKKIAEALEKEVLDSTL